MTVNHADVVTALDNRCPSSFGVNVWRTASKVARWAQRKLSVQILHQPIVCHTGHNECTSQPDLA